MALVTANGHRASLDELVERSFGDDDRPSDAIPAIRSAIRRLRRALGDESILTQPGGYQLDPAFSCCQTTVVR